MSKRKLNSKRELWAYIISFILVGTTFTAGLIAAMYFILAFANWTWSISDWHGATRLLFGLWTAFMAFFGIGITAEEVGDSWKLYKHTRKNNGNRNTSTKNKKR